MCMPILQDLDYGRGRLLLSLMDRVLLHASSLTFVHPRPSEIPRLPRRSWDFFGSFAVAKLRTMETITAEVG